MAREALRSARKEAGLTQAQVAERLGISLRHYCRIEAGERTGNFEIWDTLEQMFRVHQRLLRKLSGCQRGQAASQRKR